LQHKTAIKSDDVVSRLLLHYSMPAALQRSEGLVFSKRFQFRRSQTTATYRRVTASLTPALIIYTIGVVGEVFRGKGSRGER